MLVFFRHALNYVQLFVAYRVSFLAPKVRTAELVCSASDNEDVPMTRAWQLNPSHSGVLQATQKRWYRATLAVVCICLWWSGGISKSSVFNRLRNQDMHTEWYFWEIMVTTTTNHDHDVLCACVDPDLWVSGAHWSRSHCNVWWRQGQALERKCLSAPAEVWIVRHSFRPSQSKNRKRAVLILHGAFFVSCFFHFLFNRMWLWWFRCLRWLAIAYVCFRTM